jgi:hypothetical protein
LAFLKLYLLYYDTRILAAAARLAPGLNVPL